MCNNYLFEEQEGYSYFKQALLNYLFLIKKVFHG